MRKEAQRWVFYTVDETGHKTIYAIQKTSAPSRTKHNKNLLELLDRTDNDVERVGAMTASAWNKENINKVTIYEHIRE